MYLVVFRTWWKKRGKALEQQQNAMIKQLRKGEFKPYNKVISLVSPLKFLTVSLKGRRVMVIVSGPTLFCDLKVNSSAQRQRVLWGWHVTACQTVRVQTSRPSENTEITFLQTNHIHSCSSYEAQILTVSLMPFN